MFSNTTEYALRAMAYLAANAPASLSTARIAKVIRAPAPYLSKLMQDLRRGHLVTSRRGPRGGMTLARPANKITLLEVVDAIKSSKRPRATAAVLKPLNQKVDGIVDQLRKSLAATSLADVVAGTKRGR
jgi:Rrf2 family transcriptional regulator, nitric oxide-sensitive transcriptional repressor